jgi:hypothetical protein
VVATTTPKPVPKPAGKTVLRMDGALTRHNVGKAVTFDQKALDGMSTATATIFEPFVRKDIQFTGVSTFDLLTRAGVAPTAERVYLHALADYKVDFKVSDLMAPRCCWLPRPTVHPFPSARVGPPNWCSRLTPRRARTRTGGSGASTP